MARIRSITYNRVVFADSRARRSITRVDSALVSIVAVYGVCDARAGSQVAGLRVARIRIVARDWDKVASVIGRGSITRVGGTFVVIVTGNRLHGTSTGDTSRRVARVGGGTSDRGKDTASTNTSIGSTGVAVVTSDVVEDTLSSGRGARSWVACVRAGGAIYGGVLADSRSGGRVTSIDGTGVSLVTN